MSTAAHVAGWRELLGVGAFSTSGSGLSVEPEYPVVELSLGALGWVDISNRVRYTGESSIAITRGRSAEGSRTDPSTCRMRLDNADGYFSARLPTSPWYGYIKRNTPIRVSVIRNGTKRYRFHGEVSSWPVESDISGQDVTVDIVAGGVLRRLQQGQSSLDSALWRYIKTSGASECWPLTDGVLTTDGGFSLNQGSVMRETITSGNDHVSWGTGTLADWIEHTVNLPLGGNGYMRANMVDDLAAATGWVFAFCRAGEGDVDSITFFDRGNQTDASPRISFKVNFDRDADQVILSIVSNSGSSSSTSVLATINSSGVFDGALHSYRVAVAPSGANTIWSFSVDGEPIGSGASAAGATKAAGSVSIDWFNAAATGTQPTYGYVTYFAGPDTGADYHDAAFGYRGETANARLARLCQEESIDFMRVNPGTGDSSAPMGPQSMEALEALLRSCEDADLGLLYEPMDFLGIAYRDRESLFDQAATIELVYHSAHELGASLSPVDDDRNTLNQVQVNQEFGSNRVIIDDDPTSPLSVLPPPTGVGKYDSSVTVSLAQANQIADHGGWLVHLGTVDEARYPQIRLNLRHSTFTGDITMMGLALTLDMGHRLLITDPPAWWPPDDISQLAIGFIENLGVREHEIWVNCTPESPYHVARLEGTTVNPQSRVDTAGSRLMTPLSETDTHFPVETTVGARWFYTDNPALPNAQHPFDIRVGGEVMTVTDTTSVLGDIFARSVSNGWGTANSGQSWTTSGGAAADYSVATGGQVSVATLTTREVTAPIVTADCTLRTSFFFNAVPAGDNLDVLLMLRRVDASNWYAARVRIAAGGAMTLSIRRVLGGVDSQLATYTTGLTYVSNTPYTLEFSVVGSTLKAKIWPSAATAREPDFQATATDTSFAAPGLGGIRITPGAALSNPLPITFSFTYFTSTPQLFTVTRSTNSVVKTQLAGADVRLAYPAYLSH